ncbi:MAG TPA: DUF952 domain-containing protein [Streptosporangiaceae bacterium]|jgi:glutathione S-transferase
MAKIYHIAAASTWARAREAGDYTMSTRDRTLAQEGFIHASTAQQVAGVANKFYRGDTDLVLLEIDTDLVGPEVRYEQVPGAADPFPHIYGPLNTTAVVAVSPFASDATGQFSFPADA